MEDTTGWRLTKWVIFATVVAYILPYIILGPNAYIRIHDTLEGEWIWLKLLADSHTAFDTNPATVIPQQMKGLLRNVFPSGWNVNMFLVEYLGTYKAYLASSFMIHIIGFFGMMILLRDYFMKEQGSRFIAWFCALIFSVLPVFIPFGVAVMGQPILLWAFLNLQERKHIALSYFIIALFPFYSTLVWLPIPFFCLLGLVSLYFLVKKELTLHYVAGAVLLGAIYLLVNFPVLTITETNPAFVPHRLAYNLYMFNKPAFIPSVLDTIVTFCFVHYHSATFVTLGCFFAILLVVRRSEKLIFAIFIAIIVITVYQGFYYYPEFWLGKKAAIINSFRFNRFHILLPFLWFLAFALSLDRMWRSKTLKPLVIPFLFMQLFMVLLGNDEFLHNYRTLVGRQKFPNYENYLAPRQFAEIKQYIGQPQSSYYVASFGISPTIAQYNGFYTLDGLASIYDLHYKETFRKIFAGEIAKSKDIQQYFDGWGNRCYIFSAELGTTVDAYTCYNYTHRSVDHFDFNSEAFADMGGKYLISAVEIKNAAADGLYLEKVFNDKQSWWTIYLYSVKKL